MKKQKIKQGQPKREYVKGGRCGKIKGFDFYIQKNEKLKPFQRKRLLKESEDIIGSLIDEEMRIHKNIDRIDKNLEHLDPSLSDLELMGIWNSMYDKYVGRMLPFRDKYEREMVSEFNREQKKYENEYPSEDIKLKLPDSMMKRRKPTVVLGF